ncbi:hypothetical protein C7212DRAFT_348119 [Tuber magnatum]|uniref:Uncharacterized protein n=1 Tax=Tuber magnatum TaxID=42249 RepID=A0A317SE89_9PEZI|nr:hypothetical protein C7212DRAFT_348119 [Tuber magnatum]
MTHSPAISSPLEGPRISTSLLPPSSPYGVTLECILPDFSHVVHNRNCQNAIVNIEARVVASGSPFPMVQKDLEYLDTCFVNLANPLQMSPSPTSIQAPLPGFRTALGGVFGNETVDNVDTEAMAELAATASTFHTSQESPVPRSKIPALSPPEILDMEMSEEVMSSEQEPEPSLPDMPMTLEDSRNMDGAGLGDSKHATDNAEPKSELKHRPLPSATNCLTEGSKLATEGTVYPANVERQQLEPEIHMGKYESHTGEYGHLHEPDIRQSDRQWKKLMMEKLAEMERRIISAIGGNAAGVPQDLLPRPHPEPGKRLERETSNPRPKTGTGYVTQQGRILPQHTPRPTMASKRNGKAQAGTSRYKPDMGGHYSNGSRHRWRLSHSDKEKEKRNRARDPESRLGPLRTLYTARQTKKTMDEISQEKYQDQGPSSHNSHDQRHSKQRFLAIENLLAEPALEDRQGITKVLNDLNKFGFDIDIDSLRMNIVPNSIPPGDEDRQPGDWDLESKA